MINTSQLWLLPLLLSVAAAAQLGAQQDGRIFRTEPMGNGYARTGVNTAIFRASSLVTSQLDNNLKCVDLSDLDGDLPLDVAQSTEILRRTEPWENDSLGYPTVIRNDCGPHSDDRYYLYYAHHDLESGIGCAVADSIGGPYVKLAFSENPVIHQALGGGRKGVYRPHFVGFLGKGEYLLCWSESQPYDGGPEVIYGRTRDFRTVVRDPRGYASWPMGDGLVSPWREGDRLYLFAGRSVHVMNLPVRERRSDPQPRPEGGP